MVPCSRASPGAGLAHSQGGQRLQAGGTTTRGLPGWSVRSFSMDISLQDAALLRGRLFLQSNKVSQKEN